MLYNILFRIKSLASSLKPALSYTPWPADDMVIFYTRRIAEYSEYNIAKYNSCV